MSVKSAGNKKKEQHPEKLNSFKTKMREKTSLKIKTISQSASVHQSNQPFRPTESLKIKSIRAPPPHASSVHLLAAVTFDPSGSLRCSEWELVPEGNVLGSIGEGEDDVSQRRQRQTLTSTSLSGPADVRLAAPQIQEVETTATRHWETPHIQPVSAERLGAYMAPQLICLWTET